MKKLIGLTGRAAIITAGCVLIGVVFNAVRAEGIDLVAQVEYEIYVPCPESQAESETMTAENARAQEDVLYVDARPEEDFAREHIKGAVSLPYPLLGDPPPEKIEALKRRSVPIVTYGGGGRDQSGKMMADLLTELGVPDVSHLEGGLKSWREQNGALEKAAEVGHD
jgi:rhodanese-related sulfurtransferase